MISFQQRTVQTPSAQISYTEHGTGPVALFVHGVLLNGYLWRHQLRHLSDIRRCIAVDLLAHGDTRIAPDQDVSFTANALMLGEFLDALGRDECPGREEAAAPPDSQGVPESAAGPSERGMAASACREAGRGNAHRSVPRCADTTDAAAVRRAASERWIRRRRP